MKFSVNTIIRACVGLSVAVCASTSVAQTANIVAKDATSIANYFRDEGTTPTVTTDDYGDPKLELEHLGTEFSVWYYGCTNGAECSSIEFFSGYATNGSVRLAKINEWNTDHRFARAYVTEDGAARIEYDVFLGDTGMSPDDFANVVGTWIGSMHEFEEFIDW